MGGCGSEGGEIWKIKRMWEEGNGERLCIGGMGRFKGGMCSGRDMGQVW